MKRSDIINQAFGRIPDGLSDSFWTNQERGDFFQEACDEVHEAIVDADLPYYRVSGYTLTKNANDLYPLPSDFYQVNRLSDGNPLYFVDQDDELESSREGFRIVNHSIQLLNMASLPATITMEYTKFPKEMGDYDGDDDALSGSDDTDPTETYVPDRPLNDDRGARILKRIISAKAKMKDESLSDVIALEVRGIISTFVDRLGRLNRTEPLIVRTG